jgi:hypothetical protein
MYVVLAFFAVKGNIQYIFKTGGWGKINRKGGK